MIGVALALVGGEGELDRVDTPDVEWSAIAPHTVLFAGAIVMLTIASLRRDKSAPAPWAAMTVAIALGAIGVSIPLWNRVTGGRGPFSALGGSSSTVTERPAYHEPVSPDSNPSEKIAPPPSVRRP